MYFVLINSKEYCKSNPDSKMRVMYFQKKILKKDVPILNAEVFANIRYIPL